MSLAKDELQKRLEETRAEKEAAETSRDHAMMELNSAMETLLQVENKVSRSSSRSQSGSRHDGTQQRHGDAPASRKQG